MNLDHKSSPPIVNKINEYYNTLKNVVGCTFTLNPEFCKVKKYRSQLAISFRILNDVLSTHFMDYMIVAELTQKSNIHYHMIGALKDKEGIHLLNDHMKYHKVSRVMGFHKPEELKNQGYWISYMLKDIDKTYNIINMKGSENVNVVHEIIYKPPKYKSNNLYDLEIECVCDGISKLLTFE